MLVLRSLGKFLNKIQDYCSQMAQFQLDKSTLFIKYKTESTGIKFECSSYEPDQQPNIGTHITSVVVHYKTKLNKQINLATFLRIVQLEELNVSEF